MQPHLQHVPLFAFCSVINSYRYLLFLDAVINLFGGRLVCSEQADSAGELWVQYVSIFVSDYQIKIQVPCMKIIMVNKLHKLQRWLQTCHKSRAKPLRLTAHIDPAAHSAFTFIKYFLGFPVLFNTFLYGGSQHRQQETAWCQHVVSVFHHVILASVKTEAIPPPGERFKVSSQEQSGASQFSFSTDFLGPLQTQQELSSHDGRQHGLLKLNPSGFCSHSVMTCHFLLTDTADLF